MSAHTCTAPPTERPAHLRRFADASRAAFVASVRRDPAMADLFAHVDQRAAERAATDTRRAA